MATNYFDEMNARRKRAGLDELSQRVCVRRKRSLTKHCARTSLASTTLAAGGRGAHAGCASQLQSGGAQISEKNVANLLSS
jgi:hypothetical protein